MRKGNSIETLVDELGLLNEKAREIGKRIEELKEALKEKGVGRYLGREYEAQVIESLVPTYDVKKVQKALGKDFINVVSVSATALKEFVAPNELDKLVEETKTVTKITVKRR